MLATLPPRLMLTMRRWPAGRAARQLLRAWTSEEAYVHLQSAPLNTFCARRFTLPFGSTPTTPLALASAAIVPATCEPCPHESSYQLPVPLLFVPETLLPARSSCPM